MLNQITSNKFKKDLKKMIAQGKKYTKFKAVLELLLNQQPLKDNHRPHPLTGNWNNRVELHIEPDWLLIYKIENDTLFLERTGTHADLFG